MNRHRTLHTARQFGKAQISSVAATCCDFLTTALVYHYLPHQHVAWSTFIGSVVGGIVNCTINFHWTFPGSRQPGHTIMLRYALVWSGSILLNTWGTVLGVRLATHWFPQRLWSVMMVKAVVAVAVAMLWNFSMQKYFVFRRRKKKLIHPY